MNSNMMSRPRLGAALSLLLLGATCASAQTLPGLWGSPLYRVELTVSGTTVTGAFTSLADPQAPPGSITGQLRPDGRAFTAAWTAPAGPDTATFSTWLSFSAKGSLLTGYRWSDETQPAAFALHRAVNGQVPVLIGPEDGGGTGPTGSTVVGPVGPVEGMEVIICETAPDGQPQHIADDFVAPRSVTALVRYTKLPPNTTIQWVWTRDGQPRAELARIKEGTGWHAHSLTSQTAVAPGRYHLKVSVNGRSAAERDIIVRAAGDGTTTPTQTAQVVTLNGPTASGLLARQYDRNNFEIKLGVTWTKPGAILDTIGINAAPVGSFSLIVDGQGTMHLQVYAPACSSPRKLSNGWHVLPSTLPVKAGVPCEVTITRDAQQWQFRLAVGGKQETLSLALPVPASGAPIYVGDFPGDDSWAASYNPHRGITGTVKVLGFTGKQE